MQGKNCSLLPFATQKSAIGAEIHGNGDISDAFINSKETFSPVYLPDPPLVV
jgi:hypothetical protein